MERIVLIDGENFRAKLQSVFHSSGVPKPKWHQYDFQKLFTTLFAGLKVDHYRFYFARIKEHPQTRQKSKKLIEEQRLLKTHLERSGYEVLLQGRVRGHIDVNGKLIFKEKGVDVKLAVDMVTLACDQKVKEIILVSSDSDLQPAIAEVRKRGIKCVYVGFEQQPNKGMTFTTDRTILIRNAEIIS